MRPASAQVESTTRAGVRVMHPALWLGLCASAAVVFGAGCAGFAQQLRHAGVPWHWFEPVHLSLGLFFGKFPQDLGHDAPGYLQAARLLAPTLLAAGVIGAFVRDAWWRVRHLALPFLRGHVVIVGLDARGLRLARSLCGAGRRVVILDDEGTAREVDECRRAGCLWVGGSGSSDLALRAAGAARAGEIVVLRERDADTLDEAARVARALPTGPRVHAGLRDQRLFQKLALRPDAAGLGGPAPRSRVHMFCPDDLAAYAVFQQYPPDWPGVGADDPARVHLVLVGASALAQSLTVLAARVGHYANGSSATVWVIDPHASRAERRLMSASPHIAQAITIHTVDEDPALPGAWAGVMKACGAGGKTGDKTGGGPIVTIVVSGEDADENLLRLASLPVLGPAARVRVLVELQDRAALAAGLTEAAVRLGAQVVSIDPMGEALTGAHVFQGELDALAKAAHAHYLRGQTATGGLNPALPSHRPWEELAEEYRDANRFQAAHIGVKLRAVGLSSGPAGRPGALSAIPQEAVEALSIAEHARWNADKALAGWTYAREKNPQARQTPYLCPWGDLSEDVREWDRRAVLSIPDLLAIAGQSVYRA